MSQQVIANISTPDTLRAAFGKCNDNFTELYAGTAFPRIAFGPDDNGDKVCISVTAGVRGGISVMGTGDGVAFNDIKQLVSDEVYAALSDGDVYQWQLSLREDARFSEGTTGKVSWEFYAHRKNSTVYYTPLSFRHDGSLTVVGARQDDVGGYTAVNGRLSVGEYIAGVNAKMTVKNDNGATNIVAFCDVNDKVMLRVKANGDTEWLNASDVTTAQVSELGHAGFGRGALAGAIVAIQDVGSTGLPLVVYNAATQERFRVDTGSDYCKSYQYRLYALNTAPASAGATGVLGEIRFEASAIYVCTATNTWKKVAIATW